MSLPNESPESVKINGQKTELAINREIAKWTKNATMVALVALVCTMFGFAFSTYGEKVQVVDKVEDINRMVTKHDKDIDVLKEGMADTRGDLREIKVSLRTISGAVTKPDGEPRK